jgi:outer membrane receptor for ferrienterochelin and colicins
MKRVFLLVVFIIIHFHLGYAEKDSQSKIIGKVENKETQKEVPYLTVFVKGTSLGTTTGLDGTFKLNDLKPGNHIIRIQGIGYKPVEVNVSLEKGEVEQLNIQIEKDVFDIGSVIVSANRNKTNRKETPVIVNSITPKIFEHSASVDISESLNFSPGLRTENSCQNCGAKEIRMNGLEGQYTQILINSKPLFSSLASVYGIEQIPASMIERVEVIRGGGSALFGGNAIAGTVNLITKDPLENTYSLKGNTMLMSEDATDISIDFNTSVVNEDHTNGIFLFGMNRNRDHFDANGDGFSEVPMMKNTSAGFRGFYRPTKLTRFVIDFTKINEKRRGGNKFSLMPHETDITEQVQHDITGLNLSFDRYLNEKEGKFSTYACGQQLIRDSYYGAEQDPTAYGKTKNYLFNLGMQFSYNLDQLLFAPAKIFVGLEEKYNSLRDKKLGSANIPSYFIAKQKMNTIGGYLQSEWDMERVKLIMGMRLDHYDISDELSETGDIKDFSFNPRVNVLFDPFKKMQMRLSFAKGYRPPKVYSEDLHIEASKARTIIHRNSEGLTEENSYSISGSVDYTTKVIGMPAYFLLEGFYTILDNPFSNEILEDSENTLVFYRINAKNGARVRGLNLEGNLKISRGFDVKLGMTFERNTYNKPQQWGEVKQHKTVQMLRTPDSYGYLIGDWDINEKWGMSVTGNYTSSMLVPHFGLNPSDQLPELEEQRQLEEINEGNVIRGEELANVPAFYDIGMNLSYQVEFSKKLNMKIKAGVKNLFDSYQSDFDSGIYRDAGYIYGPSIPRTFYMTLELGNF